MDDSYKWPKRGSITLRDLLGDPPGAPTPDPIQQLNPPPFNSKATCRKCGCAHITTKYCGPSQRLHTGCRLRREHLHRMCIHCGWLWEESCLDTPIVEDLERLLEGGGQCP